jgi:two-component system chemotaxis sensor kinase CheA
MDNNDNAFQKRLLATFKVEAGEHAQALSSSLIELETAAGSGQQAAIIETVFRESHSLKGAARAVGKIEVESLCQALEGVFSQLKSKAIQLSPPLLNLLDEAVDTLDHLLAAVDNELPGALKRSLTDLGRRLRAATLPVEGGEPIAEYFPSLPAVVESEQDTDLQIPSFFEPKLCSLRSLAPASARLS